MFFRQKKAGDHVYLQIVENRWEDGRTRQRVLATLGRLDHLAASGELAALLESGARFARSVTLLSEQRRGELAAVHSRRIGAPIIFERLWQETGCAEVLTAQLAQRQFTFPVERTIFLEVLHRLVSPGSDRAGYAWKQGYRIAGVEDLDLHHAYRAMAWLGEPTGEPGTGPAGVRTIKDLIEEELFARRRDLFSSLELVFFDTTSLYFEGAGGESLGQYGHSKDHRPDLRQMIVGVVLDQEGWPICCELWPGNTTDVKTLMPPLGATGATVWHPAGVHRRRSGDDSGRHLAEPRRAGLALHPRCPDAQPQRGPRAGAGGPRPFSGGLPAADHRQGPLAVEGQGSLDRGPPVHRLPQ